MSVNQESAILAVAKMLEDEGFTAGDRRGLAEMVVNTVLRLLTVNLIRESDLSNSPSSEFARAYADLAKMAEGAVLDAGLGLAPLAAYLSQTGWLQPPGWHDCQERDCRRLDHAVNETDWAESSSGQSYQAYRCKVCGDYWGCRHQYDAGTGRDDIWHRFGSDLSKIHRHGRNCSECDHDTEEDGVTVNSAADPACE